MKKQFLLLVAVCALVSTTLNAQNEDYKGVASFNVGYSLFNALGKSVATAGSNSLDLNKISTTPTLQVAYDYGFGKVFSLGGAVSYNGANGDIKDFVFTDASGKTSTANYTLKVSRITVGLRALFHYGNAGKIDMYSGIRIGAGIWNNTFTSTNPDFKPEDELARIKNGVAPQIQIVPFGLRGYVTDNIGIGFETAIGSPYMACLQLTYRMGSGKN